MKSHIPVALLPPYLVFWECCQPAGSIYISPTSPPGPCSLPPNWLPRLLWSSPGMTYTTSIQARFDLTCRRPALFLWVMQLTPPTALVVPHLPLSHFIQTPGCNYHHPDLQFQSSSSLELKIGIAKCLLDWVLLCDPMNLTFNMLNLPWLV